MLVLHLTAHFTTYLMNEATLLNFNYSTFDYFDFRHVGSCASLDKCNGNFISHYNLCLKSRELLDDIVKTGSVRVRPLGLQRLI